MKGIYKITISLLAILTLAACSRKKNTFMSRNFHAVTAEYNTLYNGGLAYEAGKEELALTYRDNFWEILPVERVELKEEIDVPGETGDPNFNRAEQKAAKAIQKHSIYIDGQEYNPQIDEAYMMLGKARYFDERFIPAQDAFNFILNRYPTSNNINRAKVWKAKTNIRLKNEDIALENLQDMMKTADLEEEELAEASAIMAQAYINLDSLPEALPYIKLASEYEDDNELKGRYAFIKGQIYDRLQLKDSANMAYDEVIEMNRKSPRVYMINAYIAKAKNFDYETEDKVAFLELLQELEANRENRPFLDKIYNQLGEYYRNNDSLDRAIEYYNKSIKNYKQDDYLQSMNYRTLAEFNFDAAEYKTAGAYYDSTITNLVANSREWRLFKKKRENLDDVIKYEDIAANNDSILRLVGMSKAERLAVFTAHVARLKEQARLDSIANAESEERIANNEFFQKNNDKGKASGPNSTFYFYNSTTLAYGKQEFVKVWGNRKLEDNWRLSNKQSSTIDEEEVTEGSAPEAEIALYDPESYMAAVPSDQVVIDSLAKDRNFAYYQLGLIYKEKFREYDLAINRLEKLLTLDPEERLILPTKYNLYKIYDLRQNNAMASQYKNDIINNHPDSRYAEILLNPNTQLATDESSPEFKYKALYREFEASNYQYVIDTSDEYITTYNGTEIVPKLEMLKATALGRQEGFEAYKKALNYIALNYPNSKEGKEAENTYKFVLPIIANTEFIGDEESNKWKVVYRFDASEREAAEALQKKLDEAIDQFNYTDMNTSIDYYDPNTTFVIIHGLNTRMGGRGFAEVLKENKKYKIKKPYFEIASPNYKTIQIHKNLDSYLSEGTEN
ncbi:MAG: hypothetical protein R3359_00500 [Marinirhabdus sp.]|nr:hypothetical protein [Marinirhabdus sp.]